MHLTTVAAQPNRHPVWHLARCAASALALGLTVGVSSVGANTPASQPPFVLGVDESAGGESVYGQRWLRRIYGEAFKRLGVNMEVKAFPTVRLTVMLEQGMVDGEMARAFGYAAAHPNLVRVDESVIEVVFALFGTDASASLDRLEDLASGKAQVEYRRGVAVCENTLKPMISVEHLSDIATTLQGLNKLLAKRSDYFCDLDIAVLNTLYSPQFKDAGAIRKVLGIGKPAPLFAYLHRKHVDLAPKLAATLKQMKTEGLIERYRLDTLHELGRSP